MSAKEGQLMRTDVQIVQKRLPSPPLFRQIRVTGIGGVLFATAAVMIGIYWPSHGWSGTDLPKVNHAVELRDAAREDALIIAVTRDGKVFFRSAQVNPSDLPRQIRDCLN